MVLWYCLMITWHAGKIKYKKCHRFVMFFYFQMIYFNFTFIMIELSKTLKLPHETEKPWSNAMTFLQISESKLFAQLFHFYLHMLLFHRKAPGLHIVLALGHCILLSILRHTRWEWTRQSVYFIAYSYERDLAKQPHCYLSFQWSTPMWKWKPWREWCWHLQQKLVIRHTEVP